MTRAKVRAALGGFLEGAALAFWIAIELGGWAALVYAISLVWTPAAVAVLGYVLITIGARRVDELTGRAPDRKGRDVLR